MPVEYNLQKEKIKEGFSLGVAAYINPDGINTKQEHDMAWNNVINTLKKLPSLEIQYEFDYSKNWYKSVVAMTRKLKSRIFVHGPTRNCDIASVVPELKLKSVEENKRAIDFASEINAEDLVLHITPQNDYTDRENQLKRGVLSFIELSDYISQKKISTLLTVENLEYPKWPADINEALFLLKNLKEINPEVTSCVDLPHLWHNYMALFPEDRKTSTDFLQILTDYIYRLDEIAPIRRFHFANAYINRLNDVHETHGIVDLSKDCDNSLSIPDCDQMSISKSLSILQKFINFQKTDGRIPADIILEMHGPINEQLNSISYINNQLLK